jgi:Secretion system C-terminal sorting domain
MLWDSIIVLIFEKFLKPSLSHILNAHIMYKKIVLLLFLLAQISVAVAQITLEHTYDNEPFVRRYKMPVNGEVYFPINSTTEASFNVYGRNHAVLRQIPLVGQPFRKRRISDISESPTGGLRFITYVMDSLGTSTESLNLIDDRGNVLVSTLYHPSADSFTTVSFMKTVGLSDIFMVTTTSSVTYASNLKIYNLEGNLLSTLTTSKFSMNRINLDVSGEKFFRTSDSYDSVFIYNANLTPWKKIKVPSTGLFINISEKTLNADSLVEVVCVKDYYHEPCFPPCYLDSVKLMAVNELGRVVSSVSIPSINLNYIDTDEILVKENDGRNSLYTFRNGIRFLKTYPKGYLYSQKLGRFGKKYILYTVDSDTTRFYNADQTVWKVIRLPVSPNFGNTGFVMPYVLEDFSNNSSLLNLGFFENRYNPNEVNFKVANENEVELLKVTNVTNGFVSELSGLPTKLLVYNSTQKWTKVYGFPNLTATSTLSEKLNAQVFPNPFDKALTIKLLSSNVLAAQKLHMQVVDLTGKVLLRKEVTAANDIALPEAVDLPTGFYFLKIQDADNHQTVLKIVKN